MYDSLVIAISTIQYKYNIIVVLPVRIEIPDFAKTRALKLLCFEVCKKPSEFYLLDKYNHLLSKRLAKVKRFNIYPLFSVYETGSN